MPHAPLEQPSEPVLEQVAPVSQPAASAVSDPTSEPAAATGRETEGTQVDPRSLSTTASTTEASASVLPTEGSGESSSDEDELLRQFEVTPHPPPAPSV